jgi:hypothetical protein
MCKANVCPYCGRVKRWQIARAVGAADPTAMLTFTLAGNDWTVIQRRMNKLSERLRRQGYDFKWAWKVECGYTPSGDHAEQHHVHAYVYGGALPDEITWAAAGERIGFGSEVHFLELKDRPSRGPRYLWGRKTKIYEIHPLKLPHVLWMNGGRFVHASRGTASSPGFWRIDGEPVAGMDAAIRLSRVSAAGQLSRQRMSGGFRSRI